MPITNFEEITKPISHWEILLLPILQDIIKKHTETSPIKEPQIILELSIHTEKKITGVRLRRMVNHIRSNSTFPIIATSKGYFCSYNTEVIRKQIVSLRQRANSIEYCAKGLAAFV
jgi:hypothetical protein